MPRITFEFHLTSKQTYVSNFDNLHLLMVDCYKEYTKEEKEYSRVCGRVNQNGMLEVMKKTVGDTMFVSDRRILLIGNSIEASNIIKDKCRSFVIL